MVKNKTFTLSKEKIQEARKKRLNRTSKGTDSDYYLNILEEKNAFEYLRRRANQCLLD